MEVGRFETPRIPEGSVTKAKNQIKKKKKKMKVEVRSHTPTFDFRTLTYSSECLVKDVSPLTSPCSCFGVPDICELFPGSPPPPCFFKDSFLPFLVSLFPLLLK